VRAPGCAVKDHRPYPGTFAVRPANPHSAIRNSAIPHVPSFNHVNTADYALIALYFGIVIFVGWYSSRKNKNTDDFFKGGGKIPWFLAGVSNWVSGFSAFMFVAAAGFTYRHGLGAAVVFTAATWAYLVGAFYFASRWRRARINSPLEFLTRRYSRSTTYFYTVTAIVPQIIGIGQGIYILCIFVSTALGFAGGEHLVLGMTFSGLELTMITVGVVMIIYTVIGGLWAAVLSDAVQGVIILVTSLIIMPVTFMHLGDGAGMFAGFERLWTDAPDGYFGLNGQTGQALFLLSYAAASMLGYNVAWWQVQRYQSVPDERSARKMAMLCAVLSFFGPLLWILPVMGARVIFPDIASVWPQFAAPEEASFVSLALLLLPHGMIGFVVAAILSATLGQASDGFNWLAATTTRDIYVPLRRRAGFAPPGELHQMRVGQVTMLVIGVLGIVSAIFIARTGGAFDFGLKYYSLTGPGFMMPVALGMIYRKTPWWSGIASCIAAFTAAFGMMAAGAFPDNAYERNIISAISAATLVFVFSTFFYREDDPRSAECQRFDADLRTPVPVDPNLPPASLRDFQMLAIVSVLLGLVLIACVILPSSPLAPPMINVIAGCLLFVIGGLLWRASRPPRTRADPT
jgi:SSS family solute:Na+ symporter